jgi:porphobilinogen synthase
MAFPATRFRRLRKTGVLRDLVRETTLDAADLIYPMFVVAGASGRTPIGSMPGIDHLSIDHAVQEAGEAAALGIGGVMLFGLPADKDPLGSGAYDDEGVVQLATRAIKAAHPDLLVTTDLCLCEYTSHGHCGVLRADGQVDNDQTLELLARIAVSQAAAGADALAPSDMMDGRVGALRAALDEHDLPTRRSSPTPPSTPRPSTARSATRRTARRSRATGAGTRWIPPTPRRPSARRRWTPRKAPTCSWSSPRSRTST